MSEKEQKFSLGNAQYSIVLIGNFIPLMFHPIWFGNNEVLPKEEVDFAQSRQANFPVIVTPQITMFKTSQFQVRIEENRFEVVSEKEPAVLLKDFISKTFENLGSLTIRAFGLNYNAHYKIASLRLYHKIGDRLAPKAYWVKLLEKEVEGDDRKSGLISLQMRKVKDKEQGYIQIRVLPSELFKPGLLLCCNDHNLMAEDKQSAEEAMSEVDFTFDSAFQRMKALNEDLLKEVTREDEKQ